MLLAKHVRFFPEPQQIVCLKEKERIAKVGEGETELQPTETELELNKWKSSPK